MRYYYTQNDANHQNDVRMMQIKIKFKNLTIPNSGEDVKAFDFHCLLLLF